MMMRKICCWLVVAQLCNCHFANEGHGGLAEDVQRILETNCYACHSAPNNEGGFDYIHDVTLLVEKKKVLKGNPDNSQIYLRVLNGTMPPPGEEPAGPLSTSDKETLAEWIRQGAPVPGAKAAPPTQRAWFTLENELLAMRDHLRRVDRANRPFTRFFTLRNLHNSIRRTPGEIDFCRAALGKALNSVSLRQRMVPVSKLGVAGVVYAIDIRDLQWDRDDWNAILALYPYGLTHDELPLDSTINELASEVYELSVTDIPVLRADWFVTRATRPPLYHRLLDIPRTDGALEARLGVDVVENIAQGRAKRRGLENSGISQQQRLIERHDATDGYYWKSYDFKPTSSRSDLTRFPLGPEFQRNAFPQFAFKHDGGELIFRLPNGLQGYMLADGKGRRIDVGPTDVVADKSKFSGNVEIVTGLSCMACHAQGMILSSAPDIVRDGTPLGGEARRQLHRLYPLAEEFEGLVEEDRELFREAAIRAMASFAENDAALRSDSINVIEPIGTLANGYHLFALNADDIAAEIDIQDSLQIVAAVKADDRLRGIGLGPLATKDGKVKRLLWESLNEVQSPFQRTAQLLRMGTPKTVVLPMQH